jgi:hypothetical protein
MHRFREKGLRCGLEAGLRSPLNSRFHYFAQVVKTRVQKSSLRPVSILCFAFPDKQMHALPLKIQPRRERLIAEMFFWGGKKAERRAE